MARLPSVSGKDAIKALSRIGYEVDHQTGGHAILRHIAPPHRRVVVPCHRSLAKGTVRAIIRDAGLTVEQFADLL
ncbi:MAG: type II toxin-antitoxin system HicA family toxin [Phycisphaerae bacterium]